MSKTLKIVLAILLVLALGVFVVVETVLLLPEQFDHLYLGELADKYLRLRTVDATEENKIIVIGGSSVAFGINSQLMEEYLGMPVVNFGLYGPLGTTVMMDLTRGYINEGDIIVLAPETDSQTMSMYFNGEITWECIDSDFTMLFKIRPHNWGDMLGSFWSYATQKLNFYRFGKPEADGVYDHDSFNEYGDLIYTREEPIMDDWYDTEVLVDLDPSIVEDEFIDYVNEYIAYCESQGATVYYSWPPMNELAVQQDEEGVLAFATYIRENIDCQVISDITDYIMDAGYFYDTNYHVTDRGAIVHTTRLIQDLINVISDGELVSIEQPEPPQRGDGSGEPTGEIEDEDAVETEDAETKETEDAEPTPTPTPEVEETGSSEDAEYFIAEAYSGGDGLILTGVTDEGKQQDTLEVPWEIDGEKVLAIDEGCFDGCQVKSIYIQSNIERIMAGAFGTTTSLTGIYIDAQGGGILVPWTGLLDGAPSRARIYVSRENYGSFIADYFWGNYNDRISIE
ncbi:MAG: leucine-rich repeat domain-containing protein [Oscillospiraceae bacterium]|nr:leucine-rich repeat domain-containing protein [Oscillospiraceae bacterium]